MFLLQVQFIIGFLEQGNVLGILQGGTELCNPYTKVKKTIFMPKHTDYNTLLKPSFQIPSAKVKLDLGHILIKSTVSLKSI